LHELKPLAGNKPPGIYDPQNKLKPLLNVLDLKFVDLDEGGLENFQGRLVILGPFASKEQLPHELAKQIEPSAKKGLAVVWLRAAPDSPPKLTPSFYLVPEARGAVVMAEATLAANLAENPRAQLNLIELSRLAVRAEPMRLPELTP
jgi:hypothetical protein